METTEPEIKKGIQSKSADTLIIENRLRNTEPGDLVTYDELSTLLGRDVRKYCSGFVQTARKSLITEGVFFDTIKNQGYQRLDNEQACNASQHYIDRARRTAKRGINHLRHVAFDSLTKDGKKKHLTASAQLGTMHMFATGSAAKKIGNKVNGSTTPVPVGETLKLFGGATHE